MFAEEAKKRKVLNGGDRKSEVANLRPPVKNQGKASEQAAAVVSVSPRMVQEAKAIKKNNPEAFERIKSGEVTVHEQQFKRYPILLLKTTRTKAQKL